MKRIILYLLISLCITSSYPSKDIRAEKNINALLTNLFSDLDESEFAEYEQWTDTGNDSVPDWILKRFKSHMTDSCFTAFMQTAEYGFIIKAYSESKLLQLNEVNVFDKGDYYEFNGSLNIGDTELEVKGGVQTDKQGIIDWFTLYNIDDIVSELSQ